jgi:hypothetical protein
MILTTLEFATADSSSLPLYEPDLFASKSIPSAGIFARTLSIRLLVNAGLSCSIINQRLALRDLADFVVFGCLLQSSM